MYSLKFNVVPLFQYKSVTKKRQLIIIKKIKKILFVSHEQTQLFET